MADKKISALTSASTPLAGTEVLPIVQGGSTVKVAVSSLTAGREVTASKFTTAGTAATPAQFLLASGTTTAFNYGRIANTGGDLWVGLEGSTGGDLFGGTSPYDSVFGTVNATNLHLAGGAAGIKLEHSTANVIVKTGNLVFGTAGKGIVDSTGATSLQFTSLQVVSNKTIIAPSFTTAAGDTASTPTATPVTLFTPSGDGVWIVNALVTLTGAPAAYIASSMIKASGGVLAATAISTATNMSISVSGANVQATQTSGGNQVIAFSYIRLF